MPRRLLLLALPCLLAACTTGHRVYHVAAAPGDVQGIYYALPRAVLSVELEVSRHREVRGACHDELELKAGLGLIAGDPTLRGKRGPKPKVQAQAQAQVQAAPVEQPRAWTSVRAEIHQRAEVDPDEIYVIDARGRAFESLSASLELSETGLLHAAGLASEDRALDVGLAVANTAIDLTTALLGATFAGEETSTRCEVYFDEIKRLRGQRASIYSGEWRGLQGGIPRDSLDRILAGLDRHEAALLAHFTTTTRSERETVTCTITPSRGDQAHLRGELQMLFPLVHIDRASGAVSPADASVRCVIPPSLRPEGSAGKGAAHPGAQGLQPGVGDTATAYLTLDLRADGLASLVATDRGCTATRNGRCASPQGLYYRVPREASARVWWTQASDDLATQSLLIPQLGVTLALPPNTGRLSTKQAIRVYPESGALQSLEGDSKTVSAEQIQRAADTSLRVIEASSRDRELLRLERERAVLEESVRIKEAREKLGEDDPGGQVSPGGERPGGAPGGPGERRDPPPNPDPPPPTRVNGGN